MFKKTILIIFIIGFWSSSSCIAQQSAFDLYLNEWPYSFLFPTQNKNYPFLAFPGDTSHKNSKFTFSSYTHFDDFYREKQSNDLYRRAYSLRQQYTVEMSPYEQGGPVIGAGIDRHYRKIDCDFQKDETLYFKNTRQQYDIYLKYPLSKPAISPFLIIGRLDINDRAFYPFTIGAIAKPSAAVDFMLAYRQDYLFQKTTFVYDGSPLTLTEEGEEKMYLFQSRFQLSKRLLLKTNLAVGQKAKFTPDDKEANTLIMGGQSFSGRIQLSIPVSNSWQAIGAYQTDQMDLLGRFSHQSVSFGKMTKFNYHLHFLTAGLIYQIRKSQLQFQLQTGVGEFLLRGHVESWPFTETWVDLLGLRYYFKSETNNHFRRIMTSYSYNRNSYKTGIILTMEQIFPSGETRTWEPQFISLGQQNLKIYNVSISRLDGLYISFLLEKKLAAFRLVYQFMQYIPLNTKKYPSLAPQAPEDQIWKTVYGGGRHVLNIQFTL